MTGILGLKKTYDELELLQTHRSQTNGISRKVLVAASEAVPFAKTGGLGDVCGALPKILRQMGHDARLVLPRYWSIGKEKFKLKPILGPMGVTMGGGTVVWCQILEAELDGVPVYFIEHENFFGRAGIYDDGKNEFGDNAARFGFFSRAVIQLCRDLKWQPDVIHCNDWPTALIPAYLKIWEANDPFFQETATVLTIHNIAYQGIFPADHYDFLGLGPQNFTEPKFECFGKINFTKGALFYADTINTVSPVHAQEILTPEGGQGIAQYLERRRSDIYGILNGADYDHWNPEHDKLIPANYSSSDLSGKALCKTALQKEFLLVEDPSVPVIGVVSRFAHQKGLDLLAPVIESIVNNMKVQFVLLGNGEKGLEDFFGGLPARYPGRIGAWIGYNEAKAHLIEAGSDFFLMPSLYEPCGLYQIYSLKYGTLPIVRDTGGLADTVEQYDEATGDGTGFRFQAPNANAVYYAVGWAVSTYYDRPQHIETMRRRAMETHFSWKDSACQYETLYEKALARRATWR